MILFTSASFVILTTIVSQCYGQLVKGRFRADGSICYPCAGVPCPIDGRHQCNCGVCLSDDEDGPERCPTCANIDCPIEGHQCICGVCWTEENPPDPHVPCPKNSQLPPTDNEVNMVKTHIAPVRRDIESDDDSSDWASIEEEKDKRDWRHPQERQENKKLFHQRKNRSDKGKVRFHGNKELKDHKENNQEHKKHPHEEPTKHPCKDAKCAHQERKTCQGIQVGSSQLPGSVITIIGVADGGTVEIKCGGNETLRNQNGKAVYPIIKTCKDGEYYPKYSPSNDDLRRFQCVGESKSCHDSTSCESLEIGTHSKGGLMLITDLVPDGDSVRFRCAKGEIMQSEHHLDIGEVTKTCRRGNYIQQFPSEEELKTIRCVPRIRRKSCKNESSSQQKEEKSCKGFRVGTKANSGTIVTLDEIPHGATLKVDCKSDEILVGKNGNPVENVKMFCKNGSFYPSSPSLSDLEYYHCVPKP
uniref:Uncharacterized protein n=1 Tax=Plectus sambesii TaxID=2011161 RepID=A0A914X4Z5_9BILA